MRARVMPQLHAQSPRSRIGSSGAPTALQRSDAWIIRAVLVGADRFILRRWVQLFLRELVWIGAKGKVQRDQACLTVSIFSHNNVD